MRFGDIYNDSLIGTQRVIQKFLWLPLTIDNQTRWFETARIKQTYTNAKEEYSETGYIWKDTAWVD